MKEIYIVRHGQTDYNLKGIVQGRGVNSSLNETGRQQARAFYEAYHSVGFDAVYTSRLIRTHQTMEAFIKDIEHHESHAELDEIDWGIFEGVEHDPQMHQRYLSIIDRWKNSELDIKIDGGESADDLALRLSVFVTHLREAPHARILVCSHGRSIRALLCLLTNTPLNRMDDFPHANTCLYKLNYQNGAFEIELFNCTSHLDGKL